MILLGKIKQFTPKRLVSGDTAVRVMLEINQATEQQLSELGNIFVAERNNSYEIQVEIK